jgi:hypothetical protein
MRVLIVGAGVAGVAVDRPTRRYQRTASTIHQEESSNRRRRTVQRDRGGRGEFS